MTPNITPNIAGRRVKTTRRNGTRRARYVTAAVALAVVGATGCSGEDLAEGFIENRIEAESGEQVDIDLDGGNFRLETEDGVIEMNTDGDGNISIRGDGVDGDFSIDSEDGVTVFEGDDGATVIDAGGSGVPDGFPGSVPLPDGFEPQVSQSVASAQGDGWVLGGEMNVAAADVAAAYLSQLEAAGFEQLQLTETPDTVIFSFDNGEYTVSGLAGDNGGGATYFNVTVAESQG